MPNVGDVSLLRFRFLNDDGEPFTPDDTPTLYLALGATVVENDTASLIAPTFEHWFTYSYTSTAAGVVFARAKTTDTDAAGDGTTDALTFDVVDVGKSVWDRLTSALTTTGSVGKALVDGLTTLLARTSAGVTVVSPVREVGGETEIAIKQGETMSAALDNAIEITFSGVPDSTGCDCVLTFVDKNGKLLSSITGNPFTGTLGTWSGGAVTATWELSAAVTALFPVSKMDRTDLENTIRFEAKITGYASSGVLKPVMPKTGNVVVYTGAWSS